MLMDFLKHIIWLDVLVVLLFIRIVFIGIKTGFIAEFFKMTGVLIAIFITFHYYSVFSQALNTYTHMPLSWAHFTAMTVLWGVVGGVTKLFRDGFLLLFKVETTNPGFNQWAAGCLAVVRGVILSSLMVVMVSFLPLEYVIKQSESSLASRYIARVAPFVYVLAFERFVGRLFPDEKLNTDAAALAQGGEKKSPSDVKVKSK